MTLGIVLIAKDGTIVLASDKRVTEGTSAMTAHGDFVQKIHRVTDNSGLTIAGDGGAAIAVIDPFLKEVGIELTKQRPRELSIGEISELFRRVAVDHFTKWFKDMSMAEWVSNVRNDIIPYFRVLLAGFDMDDAGQLTIPKIVELSSIRRFAPTNITGNFGTVGITTIAQYLLYRFYAEKQEEQAAAGLAAFCIQETSSQDDGVGEDFQIAAFRKNQSFQFYSDAELKKIKLRAAELKTEFEIALLAPTRVKEDPVPPADG
jgi:20S proteasome alpha/beta subunit